ncbi:MAG: hypothetical protein OXO50_21155 [Caldilineaceae bacterium]|nr:hypothetical protein [Caldilineaceae bacterium]
MNNKHERSDATLYYHEGSAVETASRDSSAAWGNLADAMRDAIVIIPNTFLGEPLQILPSSEDDRRESMLNRMSIG